ncbi:MAG: carboxyl-terminal processing protease [Puniceicoccaceae bacterium 5H]|nr:MAG: carboxyl-terminal processing protease [Puniceicoccaceae bacterium 5H]
MLLCMFKRLFVPGVLLLAIIGLFSWLMWSPFWQSLREVGAVFQLIHREYYDADAVDYEALRDKALKGTLHNLDPYSRYFTKEDFKSFRERSEQRYVGVGIEIQELEDDVTVVTVFPGSSAEQAGVLPGDQIVRVDATDVSDFNVEEVTDAIRGEEGQPVELGLFRPAVDEELSLEVMRAPVEIPSVLDTALTDDGIGYLRLSQFGERTSEEFAAALDQLERNGMQALIIDLRNNPGGYLSAAKEVTEQFLDEGQLIVYTAGRDEADRTEYVSDTPARVGDYPVAVLVNHYSASGSEIVAGVLQDVGRAVVVGETSFGKGSVQTVHQLRFGGAVSQTTALYYFPSGTSIHNKGVEPDIAVEVEPETARKLEVQHRHADRMTPEEFERIFEFKPDLQDAVRNRAEDYLRGELTSSAPAAA